MWTLNLAKPDSSDIMFKVSKFPDGQQDVTLEGFRGIANPWPNDLIGSNVKIISRFNSFKDLELIVCATKAARKLQLGGGGIELEIPYLLGARSDRQFVTGGTSYLVDVIAPILNEQNYWRVTTLDVHSDVAAACIHNLVNKPNYELVGHAMFHLFGRSKLKGDENLVLISPDAGALKKVYKVAEHLGFKGQILTCSKDRDEQGKLSKTIVPLPSGQFFQNKKYVILDDICDGGRTFINIARELLPLIGKEASIHLIVTHGIFSAGYDELNRYFNSIYTTNSIQEFPDNVHFTVQTGGNPAISKAITELVKPFNVF